jgi:hypothetical protein
MKCAFDQDTVEFLGHFISSAGISQLLEKVSSVVSWPTTTCLTELQSFIGFCNYYRRFIRKFSQLALSLMVQKKLADRGKGHIVHLKDANPLRASMFPELGEVSPSFLEKAFLRTVGYIRNNLSKQGWLSTKGK